MARNENWAQPCSTRTMTHILLQHPRPEGFQAKALRVTKLRRLYGLTRHQASAVADLIYGGVIHE